MATFRLWVLLARRQHANRLTTTLAVVAFAFSSGAFLMSAGGFQAFYRRDPYSIYTTLAVTACVILVVPILTLGASAARLCVASRDDRLAKLRLAGATTFQVSCLAIIDATVQAFVGALFGVLIYLAAIPLVALLRFQGRPFEWAELLVPWWGLGAAVLLITLIGCISAVSGLIRVAITPLGVTNRVSPRTLSLIRFAFLGALLVIWRVFGSANVAVMLTVIALLGVAVNLVGPLLLFRLGKAKVKRARTLDELLAARRLLSDPKSAWRSVAGIGFATYVAVMASVFPGLAARANPSGGQHQHLAQDMLTGSLVTLGITAVVAAVSTAVTQSAKVLDNAPQYRALAYAGTDIAQLKKARRAEAILPLRWAMGLAIAVAGMIVVPIVGLTFYATWGGVALAGGTVVASVALVLIAVQASQPLVDKVADLNA